MSAIALSPASRRRRATAAQELPADYIWRPSLAPLGGIWLTLALLAYVFKGTGTHAIVVDLPPPVAYGAIGPLSPPATLLHIDASGAVSWNGETVSPQQLEANLVALAADPDPMELRFVPDRDAAYGAVYQVLGQVYAAGLLDHCFSFHDIWPYRHLGDREPDGSLQPNPPAGCFSY